MHEFIYFFVRRHEKDKHLNPLSPPHDSVHSSSCWKSFSHDYIHHYFNQASSSKLRNKKHENISLLNKSHNMLHLKSLARDSTKGKANNMMMEVPAPNFFLWLKILLFQTFVPCAFAERNTVRMHRKHHDFSTQLEMKKVLKFEKSFNASQFYSCHM